MCEPSKRGVPDEEVRSIMETCDAWFEKKLPNSFVTSTMILAVHQSNELDYSGMSLIEETSSIIYKAEKDKYFFSEEYYASLEWYSSWRKRQVLQHYQVMWKVYAHAMAKKELSEEVLIEWHRILMTGTDLEPCGVYRNSGCYAGTQLIMEAVYIQKCVEELISNTNKELKENTISPWAHAAKLLHSFISIHPFESGNGKMSRLLANYVLWYHRLPFAVPFTSSKSKYTRALRYADREYEGPKRTCELSYIILMSAAKTVENLMCNERLCKEMCITPQPTDKSSK